MRRQRKFFSLLKSHWPTALFVVLLLLWVGGGKTKTMASICCVLALGSLLLRPLALQTPERTARLPKWAVACMYGSTLAFPLLVGLHEYGMVLMGTQGIDYAIFTQAMHNAGERGAPVVSLVSQQPTNFLSHHFSPFLYLAGLIVRLGVSAHLVGIGLHVASIAGGLFAVFAFARSRKLDNSFIATLLCLTWAAPTMSVAMLWGIHDETYCLPLIGFGLHYWLKGKFGRSALLFAATGLFKETMFLFAMAVPFALSTGDLASSRTRRDFWLAYGSLAVVGAVGAVGYWLVRPNFVEVSFDAASRIASLEELLEWDSVLKKLRYLFWIFAPSLFLGFLTSKGRAVLLLSLPFVGLSLVSNFPEMFKALNYYSVIPGYLACFAAVVTISERTGWRGIIPMRLALLSLAMSMSQQGVNSRPLKTFRSINSGFVAVPGTLSFIPDDFRVLVTDFDAGFVIEKEPVRLWSANRAPHDWDGILERKSTGAPISHVLRKQVVECYEDDTWRLLCKRSPLGAIPSGSITK